MTSTTPFLLAGSNLPESSQLTDTANKNGLSPLAVSAQTDVETVVQEVLGFATALLEASEQVGKDLPLSGKTLPLDTNSLPTDEDATPIAVPLPLTDELEVRVLKPQEAAALLPVRTPEVAIDAAQRQQFEADVNVVVPSSPIVRESTPRTAEVSAQPLRNQNGRPGIQWIEPRTQPAESAPRLLTESDGLGDSRVVQSGLPLEAGSERKYLGSQTPTAAPLSPATSDPKTTAENALEFALTDNRQESLRGEVDTDTRLRLESHNHVIRRSLATQASLSINPLESTVAGLVSPTPAGPTAPLPLLTLPTTMVAPDGSLEPQWGQDFAERVGWVVHAKVPKAQLRLHPESLGPIELRSRPTTSWRGSRLTRRTH